MNHDQYNSQNKRGSEFKKSAQHILNRWRGG